MELESQVIKVSGGTTRGVRPDSAALVSARLLFDWQHDDTYRFMHALPAESCAWEFLRRDPKYEASYRAECVQPIQQSLSFSDNTRFPSNNSSAADWNLVRFENPALDALSANVFWQPKICRTVIPLLATTYPTREVHRGPWFSESVCRVTKHIDVKGRFHVLFAQEGRFLQLEILGSRDLRNVRLTMDVLLSADRVRDRLNALRRLNDFIAHGVLRPQLYPVERRARRLAQVLQAFDGWRADASHREIARAIFGETRVAAEWREPSGRLRDWVRRTLRTGRRLVNGGYVSLLK